jgi:hypothetical protein
MSAVRRRTPDELALALLWAIAGGGLVGGLFVTVQSMTILEKPWLLILGPAGIAALSMFVVFPCTLAFGLPSVMLIHHLNLGRWSALAVCIIAATATQIACVWLVFWDEYSEVSDFLFTTPFAVGAATVLWWRLTRP